MFPKTISSFERDDREATTVTTIELPKKHDVEITKNVSPALGIKTSIPTKLIIELSTNKIVFDQKSQVAGKIQLPYWISKGFTLKSVEFNEENRTVGLNTNLGTIVYSIDDLLEMI